MIALVFVFLGSGLLGLAAYGALIVVGGMIISPFYLGYRLVRFIVRLAVVLAHAAFFIAWDVFRLVRFVDGLAFRAMRFVALAFVHVGATSPGSPINHAVTCISRALAMPPA